MQKQHLHQQVTSRGLRPQGCPLPDSLRQLSDQTGDPTLSTMRLALECPTVPACRRILDIWMTITPGTSRCAKLCRHLSSTESVKTVLSRRSMGHKNRHLHAIDPQILSARESKILPMASRPWQKIAGQLDVKILDAHELLLPTEGKMSLVSFLRLASPCMGGLMPSLLCRSITLSSYAKATQGSRHTKRRSSATPWATRCGTKPSPSTTSP